MGYINTFLNSNPENWEVLEKDDLEIRDELKNAIYYFGSDKAVINYINSNRDKLINYNDLIDWLLNFSTP